jgi:hypothetical protein
MNNTPSGATPVEAPLGSTSERKQTSEIFYL